MTVQIVTSTVALPWIESGVHTTVQKYIDGLTSASDIGSIATATNLTYAQVAWALGYVAKGGSQPPIIAIPTQESELSEALMMNQMWS